MTDDHVENIIEKLHLCRLMHLFKERYSFQPMSSSMKSNKNAFENGGCCIFSYTF